MTHRTHEFKANGGNLVPLASPEDASMRASRHRYQAVVLVADGPHDDVPLLVGRDPVDGRPAAYVCRHLVCERPVTSVAELTAALTR